jgi:hypothetical protein
MKLGRPNYSKETQLYVCECKDEENIFRIESIVEDGKWTPALEDHLERTRDQMISVLLEKTEGWFSKPLTKEWLLSKLRYTIPTSEIASDFEGRCAWMVNKLNISKDSFTVDFILVEKLSNMVPLIDLHVIELETPTPVTPDLAASLREEKKLEAIRARRRAGMALLKAERLMQSYAAEFGEDTDWEDEDE